jgi:hypothetical protein
MRSLEHELAVNGRGWDRTSDPSPVNRERRSPGIAVSADMALLSGMVPIDVGLSSCL